MASLPQDLIDNILSRLPVKSLLRFKSVCKAWRSLISGPGFAQSHYEMSSSLADKIVHITNSGARSIDFHSSLYDDSAVVNLNFPFIPPPDHDMKIRGSCRGFVLVDPDYELAVWNPSTGLYKRVYYFPGPSDYLPYFKGLGYDASDDDYLVVVGACDPTVADYEYDFQFFSMKAYLWKRIEGTHNFPYKNPTADPRAGLFLNQAIHWLALRKDTKVELILAFSVTQRKLIEIPLPDDFFEALKFVYLGKLGGCLSLSVLGDHEVEHEIWLMKEYGMKSSWTKFAVVSVEIPGDYFFPISLTKSGGIVGSHYSDGGKALVKCNDEGKVLEYREYNDRMHQNNAIVYTESLFSLPSDGEELSEDEQQE